MPSRLSLLAVGLFAFTVGCLAPSATHDAAGTTPPIYAGFACPAGQAIIGFDGAAEPLCGSPWLAASSPPTVTPQAHNLSLSEMSCAAGSGGNARFTIVGVSPDFASSSLRVTDSTNPGLAFALAGLSNPIRAGDSLTATANGGVLGCSDVLNFVDAPSGNVVATLTLHP
ncbi:MAG: hypothetical protein ACYDCK_00535 [Thermoplasmatota archaeon]